MHTTHRLEGVKAHLLLLLRVGLSTAVAGLLLTSVVAPALAAPAQAAVTGYQATTQWIGGGTFVNVRPSANTSSRVAYRVRPGTGLSIECQTVGSRLGFSRYADNRTWDRLSDGRYVHDVLTTTPGGTREYQADGGYAFWSPQIPRCSPAPAQPVAPPATQTRETRAVDFARSQLGVTTTAETDDGVWTKWCERFAEVAFGTRGKYYSAKLNYTAQLQAGRIRTDTNPPAGALVFYESGTFGHVGVSIGDGQVISTQGSSGALPVYQHGVTGLRIPYLGWAPAPDSWPGR